MRSEGVSRMAGSVKAITEEIRGIINSRAEPLTDREVLELIEDFVLHEEMAQYGTYQVKRELIQGVFNATRKDLDLLQPYADDPEISEIMVNGTDHIFVERRGRVEQLPIRFESREDLEEIIRRLAARVHREINELNPIVDARMEDGSRVNAVYKNVALNGPILTIRKFPEKQITMEELIEKKSITPEAAEFLKVLVSCGYNIFISGGTSSGKTTFLNVLSGYIPKQERVIVIEDSAELQMTEVSNLVRLETRSANVQGKGEVTMRQLIRASLRMRPDRVIVGEVRGEEVFDMIQAMNTGHDGSISTGHGNSPEGMLRRMEAMFLTAVDFPVEAIRNQIAEAVDLVVHLGRMPDGSRKVLEITEVIGYTGGEILLNQLFQHRNGTLVLSGNRLRNAGKLRMRGIEDEQPAGML